LTTFVFDASAVLRFLDKELGWERVANLLTDSMGQRVEIAISAVQWGEIAGGVRRKSGPYAQERALGLLASFPIRIEPATEQRAVHAAELKVDRKIAYADAFALDLAMESPEHVLLTSEYGFKAVDDLARIEYLPAK
jgi:PIN domain nuclease of toxin-antitoxin system